MTLFESSVIYYRKKDACDSTNSLEMIRCVASVTIMSQTYKDTPWVVPSWNCLDNEYTGLLVEWLPDQCSIGQFGFATSIGSVVRLLSLTMVVSMRNVLPFQTVSRFLERIGLSGDGVGCGGQSHVGKQFCSGGVDGF